MRPPCGAAALRFLFLVAGGAAPPPGVGLALGPHSRLDARPAALTSCDPAGKLRRLFSRLYLRGHMAITPFRLEALRTVTEIPFCWWGVAKR